MFAHGVSNELLKSLFDLRDPVVHFLEGKGVVRDDAEDIFQDTLLAFQEGLGRFDPHFGASMGHSVSRHRGLVKAGSPWIRKECVVESVSPDLVKRARRWFWGILRNKVRAHYRHCSRWIREVPEQTADPPDYLVIRLPELLSRLTDQEAEVLTLRFMEGADLARVAEHCGVSVPTAHRRVRQALVAARAQI
ncbi:MAG: sigma-70 family RNA polymerase sigma factor [Candidatus Eisenbacteria bacterium]|uniref:Sigma-70 family RNA polymerase sigma factor n=1 Tax=Eiseniibacteriota bacterium TaxID=2212470 RepID=A0A948RZZ2_UNCEI|nr:sigma-70 family RNA polymerase sigma factor [Candidatus Eisenbacteria bacterium]MBU1949935.1 sigma-70 family RNA polymerase sigma factor [Candidatus Eisenbacteria bacterium]MBU2692773.1 sigma-70 family RNA polymerase sigma factor [Candidatus Eisenbacteria bacterium]